MTQSGHYRNILKTTSLIGGSSLINILIGMVRTKFVAVLLGPAGVGLMGVYGSITGIVGTVSGMGISNSGVRQIAEACGSKDEVKIAKTVIALRRVCWLTGFLGFLIMATGSWAWSKSSFGNYEHTLPIAFLGITILLGAIAGGQSCILQGTRRITDLAKSSIIGSVNGTLICIPCFYLWGMNGIVPSLILGSIANLITSWWFARKISVLPLSLPWRESKAEAFSLLTFGIPMMLSGLMTALAAYLIRIVLIWQTGLGSVGIYQAAFAISGTLVGFVLNAMGTDYYPRLTAVASDNHRISQEVNTQTEIALLLAMPGLAATIVFAPLAIVILYSGKFDDAVPILRWSVYGILGQVISWPLGFVIAAKGRSKVFLCVQIFANGFHILMLWICVKLWGLPGTGIAFMLLYVATTAIVYTVVCKISHTHWTRSVFSHVCLSTVILALLGLNCALTPIAWLQWILSLITLTGLSFYCLRRLSVQTGITLQTVIAKFRN